MSPKINWNSLINDLWDLKIADYILKKGVQIVCVLYLHLFIIFPYPAHSHIPNLDPHMHSCGNVIPEMDSFV